ncbi:hypothetical protein GT755_10735 [Herbidospora sp. NEAU-GS84]|uniref:Pentapeptide repeat-containing protein n=1 Tax=Herbidospora solisilvae TaxID=2696284 RepID=A0A7C9NG51_9ACTN|nr:pentapeptide repeat-containing protein [Herbidospora solisilvae]NAS22158.1 hypothetical protein [Herbidospora solisilvae]
MNLFLIGGACFVVLGWTLGPGAAWILEHFDGVALATLESKDLAAATDAVRGKALTVATAVGAAIAIYFTAKSFQLSRQNHVTDRFSKAIEQLGSMESAIRLGGIYSLERIAKDSPRDHPAIMAILAAFVRNPPPIQRGTDVDSSKHVILRSTTEVLPEKIQLRFDIQAALTVLGRRNVGNDKSIFVIDFRGADLSYSDLAGCRFGATIFADANLTKANLAGTYLADSNLGNTNLSGANLIGANLKGAILINADLTQAELMIAKLDGANLRSAKLVGANLKDAYLWKAIFVDADLTDVVGLPSRKR